MNDHSPLESVVVVTGMLNDAPVESRSSTPTLSMPGSPLSCTPLAFRSSQTKLPSDARWNIPASTKVVVWPSVRVKLAVAPVVRLASESVSLAVGGLMLAALRSHVLSDPKVTR